jgi:NitT/TauT family transport system substrate-binding protein
VYMLLEDVCRKHGMELTDLNVVELPYPNMQPAFASGVIQAAVHLEPFMTQTIRAGLAKDICDFTEFTPARGGSIVPVVYGESFIANRGAAQEFMTAYMRGVRIYNDAFAKNIDREKVIEIISRRAGLNAKIVRESYPAGLDPDQELSRPFISRLQDFFIRQGFQRSPTELDQLIDSSFAEQSVKTLGRYV